MLGGVGEGLSKLLRAAENRDFSAYVITGFLFAYAIVSLFFVARHWRQNWGSKTLNEIIKAQLAVLISSVFVIAILVLLLSKLVG